MATSKWDNCPACGKEIEIQPGRAEFTCPYCKTVIEIELQPIKLPAKQSGPKVGIPLPPDAEPNATTPVAPPAPEPASGRSSKPLVKKKEIKIAKPVNVDILSGIRAGTGTTRNARVAPTPGAAEDATVQTMKPRLGASAGDDAPRRVAPTLKIVNLAPQPGEPPTAAAVDAGSAVTDNGAQTGADETAATAQLRADLQDAEQARRAAEEALKVAQSEARRLTEEALAAARNEAARLTAEARERAEAEARRVSEEARRLAEDEVRRVTEEALREAMLEREETEKRRRAAEEEARSLAEAARIAGEEARANQMKEMARQRAIAEARERAVAAAKAKAVEEAKHKAVEEARSRAVEAAKEKAIEEMKRKKIQELTANKRQEAKDEQIRQYEEEARKRIESELKKLEHDAQQS